MDAQPTRTIREILVSAESEINQLADYWTTSNDRRDFRIDVRDMLVRILKESGHSTEGL